jgi:transposase
MQGLHAFDPQARTVIDLESFVAKDHLLRRVDRELDLSFVRELTAPCYSQTGRPSIDPEVFFRMLLVAYLYGIDSERHLCEEVRYHLAYRWFCRLSLDDEVPDHSSFTRIRDRFGEEVFLAVFRRIVELCQKKGLIQQECRVMTDATLIAADAALDSLVHNDPDEAARETEALRGRARAVERPPSRKISNQTHTSRTDPDATLAQKHGSPRQLKYKVHQTIDADSRVILDTHVTTGACHENRTYLEQLQRVGDHYNVRIVEATADRGYGAAATIRALQQQGIVTYIPLWNRRSGRSKYFQKDLVYEKEKDRFRCTAGKYLTPNPTITENRKCYVISAQECRNCPHASSCSARVRPRSLQRIVVRSLDQDLFEQVQAKMRDPTFGEKLSERMWKSEGLFAEAKQNHNLARAKYRGRAKVQIQAYLSGIAQNLKRLVCLFWHWLITRCLNRSKGQPSSIK